MAGGEIRQPELLVARMVTRDEGYDGERGDSDAYDENEDEFAFGTEEVEDESEERLGHQTDDRKDSVDGAHRHFAHAKVFGVDGQIGQNGAHG